MSAPNPANPKPGQHAGMPPWQDWLYRNAALSLLILAEGVIIFLLVAEVSVPDLAHPETWSWYNWALVSAGLALALAISGMAVKLSIEMVGRFNEGRRFSGAMLLFGIVTFSTTEVWCSIAERSTIVHPTPADSILFSWLGLPITPITFSVVFVSLLLPFASIYTGFTLRPVEMEDAESWNAKAERKLAQERLKAEQRKIRMRSRAEALAGAFDAAKQTLSHEESTGGPLDPLAAEDMTGGSHLAGNDEPDSSGKYRTPGGRGSRAKPSVSLPRGYWTASHFYAWVTQEYGEHLTRQEAAQAVKHVGGGRTADNMAGKPYVAAITALKAWAKRQIWAQSIQLVPDRSAEERAG